MESCAPHWFMVEIENRGNGYLHIFLEGRVAAMRVLEFRKSPIMSPLIKTIFAAYAGRKQSSVTLLNQNGRIERAKGARCGAKGAQEGKENVR